MTPRRHLTTTPREAFRLDDAWNRKGTDPDYCDEDRGYDTPCWIWQRNLNKTGYGTIMRRYRQLMAHRYSWELVNGPIPEGLQLDHLCRVPACVNPDHLEPVTPAENQRRGKSAKINMEIAEAIRASDERQGVLAERYGIDPSLVSRIRTGKKWRADR